MIHLNKVMFAYTLVDRGRTSTSTANKSIILTLKK